MTKPIGVVYATHDLALATGTAAQDSHVTVLSIGDGYRRPASTPAAWAAIRSGTPKRDKDKARAARKDRKRQRRGW